TAFESSACRRDVEAEPFHRHRFHGAVGHGGADGRIELRLQLGIALAQADRDAETERTAAIAWPGEHHLLVLWLFDDTFEIRNRGEHAVDATGREIEIVLLR